MAHKEKIEGPTITPLSRPIETAPVSDQIIAHEPMYGWLIVSKQEDGSFLQKSSGNLWMEVSPTFTRWIPYPGLDENKPWAYMRPFQGEWLIDSESQTASEPIMKGCESDLMEKIRTFMDLFVQCDGVEPFLSVQNVDLKELSDRYNSLYADLTVLGNAHE